MEDQARTRRNAINCFYGPTKKYSWDFNPFCLKITNVHIQSRQIFCSENLFSSQVLWQRVGSVFYYSSSIKAHAHILLCHLWSPVSALRPPCLPDSTSTFPRAGGPKMEERLGTFAILYLSRRSPNPFQAETAMHMSSFHIPPWRLCFRGIPLGLLRLWRTGDRACCPHVPSVIRCLCHQQHKPSLMARPYINPGLW